MRRALAVLLVAGACHTQAAAERNMPKLPEGAVRFETPRGPWVVRVEIAASDASRARGLMLRRELPPDHGMLFVFPSAQEHGFWMHDTLLALDMIFLADDRSVVGVVANAAPMTDSPRSVGQPSRYVVEVAAGEAAAHAVGPGTRVSFVDVAE